MSTSAFFVSSRRRRGRDGDVRHFPPGRFWLIGSPRVGQRMALLTNDSHRSIFTSPIERMVASDDATLYVETRGSVYELARTDTVP